MWEGGVRGWRRKGERIAFCRGRLRDAGDRREGELQGRPRQNALISRVLSLAECCRTDCKWTIDDVPGRAGTDEKREAGG